MKKLTLRVADKKKMGAGYSTYKMRTSEAARMAKSDIIMAAVLKNILAQKTQAIKEEKAMETSRKTLSEMEDTKTEKLVRRMTEGGFKEVKDSPVIKVHGRCIPAKLQTVTRHYESGDVVLEKL